MDQNSQNQQQDNGGEDTQNSQQNESDSQPVKNSRTIIKEGDSIWRKYQHHDEPYIQIQLNGIRHYKCTRCQKVFKQKRNAANHAKQPGPFCKGHWNNTDDEGKLRCKICLAGGRPFAAPSSLIEHVVERHRVSKVFKYFWGIYYLKVADGKPEYRKHYYDVYGAPKPGVQYKAPEVESQEETNDEVNLVARYKKHLNHKNERVTIGVESCYKRQKTGEEGEDSEEVVEDKEKNDFEYEADEKTDQEEGRE